MGLIPKMYLSEALQILDKSGALVHDTHGRVESYKRFASQEFISASSDTSHRVFINDDIELDHSNYIVYKGKRYQVLDAQRLETFGVFHHLEITI